MIPQRFTLFGLFLASSFLQQILAAQYTTVPPRPLCFRSTYDIIVQQLVDPLDEYIVCPNTRIDIGVPASSGMETFVNGDWPLLALGPNVVIKCGQSGASSNNCVLNSSFLHIAALPNVRSLGVLFVNAENLYISGFTLTGRK